MKTNILSKLLAAVTLALCACALLSCQTAPVQRLIAWEQTPGSQARHQFELRALEMLATVAVQAVVEKAAGSADLQAKHNFFDSAALGLRSLEGRTGGIVTPELVRRSVENFTGSSPHWSAFADTLAAGYSASTAAPDAKLETIAATLNAH